MLSGVSPKKLEELKVLIIGCGASGAAAANACVAKGVLPENIKILEKNARAGGEVKNR